MHERSKHPTTINLDSRRLTRCFQIKQEPDLEVINYQHNSIEVIEFVSGYKKLVLLISWSSHSEIRTKGVPGFL